MQAQIIKNVLDPIYLGSLAERYHQQYMSADPFAHIVIDNFLPDSILNEVLNEFPNPDEIQWKEFDNKSEKKLASVSEQQMGHATRFLLYQLNSSTFITFLEKLTGIDGIIPDPHFVGGGLHQIKPGGYLKIHADFNKNTRLKLDRRLNLLLYLNKDWSEGYGGHLELWDVKMKACQRKILPIFNRCVIFSTTDFSYHGHPNPLTCPDNRTRKSLALYYYSNGRPSEEVGSPHTTIFRERPNENLKESISWSKGAQIFIKKLVPPIFIDLLSVFKK
jgi:hypothetical protein